MERPLSDQSESEEVAEHLLPLQRQQLVQPHLTLVLVIVPGLLPAHHGAEDHGTAALQQTQLDHTECGAGL